MGVQYTQKGYSRQYWAVSHATARLRPRMHQAMPSAVLHTSAGPRQCFVSEPSFRNSAWRGDYHGGATTCSAHSTTRLPADISVTRRQLCISTGQMVAGALLLARPATAADDAAKMRHLSTEALRDIIVVSPTHHRGQIPWALRSIILGVLVELASILLKNLPLYVNNFGMSCNQWLCRKTFRTDSTTRQVS